MVGAAKKPTKPDLRALTGLRGIAAWLVVFYHIRTGMGTYLPDTVMAFLAKGYLAVDFFFLLSGFVIWLSYADKFADRGIGFSAAFLWRRVARIWPLHLFILLATIAFVGVLIATGRDYETGYPLHELPLHIVLLQNWGFTPALSWNHPAWSISTEMAAYILFPLLAIGAPWQRCSTAALIGIATLLIVSLHLYFSLQSYATLGDDIPRTGLVRCLIQFALGTVLCVLWTRWRKDWQMAHVTSLSGLVLFLVFAFFGIMETLLVPAAFALFLIGMAIFAERASNPLNHRVLHYFGEISYATYLVHFMLFVAFKILFVADPLYVAPHLVALFLALTFGISALLYHVVEKRGQKLLLRWSPTTTASLATK